MSTIEALADALQIARDLNEPDEDNDEYARGQANLIADLYGLSGEYYEMLMDVIQHRVGFSEGISRLAYELGSEIDGRRGTL